MGRRPQEGNAAWKASRAMTQIGGKRHRYCKAIDRDGNRCRGICVKKADVCYMHGGRNILNRRKIEKARKLRYAAWTNREATSNA